MKPATTTIINYLSGVYELEKQCSVLNALIQQEKNKTWPEIPMPPKVNPIPHTVFQKKPWPAFIVAALLSSAFLAGISFVLLFIFGGYFLDKQGMKMGDIADFFFHIACGIGLLIFIISLPLKVQKDRGERKKYELEQLAIDQKNAKTAVLYQQALKARAAKEQENMQEMYISRKNLARLEQIYDERHSLLKKYYDLDILYKDYRGLARVSKYLEYLQSERCTTLGEAYNLCEPELRDSLMIEYNRLILHGINQMNQNIDSIRTTNIMMYNALSSINENVNRIQGGFEQQHQQFADMRNRMTAIENNTQATAYFSETTAKNTKLLADYADYQYFVLHQERLAAGHLY